MFDPIKEDVRTKPILSRKREPSSSLRGETAAYNIFPSSCLQNAVKPEPTPLIKLSVLAIR